MSASSYPRRPKVIHDLPAYLREKNAKRRAAAKLLGICIECNSAKAAPCRTKCTPCLTINALRIQTQRQKTA